MPERELEGDAITGLEDAVVVTHGDGTQEVIQVPPQPEPVGRGGMGMFVVLTEEQIEQIADVVIRKLKRY